MSILSRIGANAPKLIAKGIGLGTLGIIGYDAHVVGKLQSEVTSKSADANASANFFNNTMYLDTHSSSKSKLARWIFNLELEQNWRSFFNSSIGYSKGVASMLVSNAIPFALSTLALVSKSTVGSWIGAAGSLLYGCYVVAKDGLGIGKHNDLNPKF